MAGPARGQQDAPQAPTMPSKEIEELRAQLAQTQAQLGKVLELLTPPE